MNFLRRLVKREPVLVSAVVAIVVNLGVVLGFNLSETQVLSAISTVIAILAPLVRAKVSPVDKGE